MKISTFNPQINTYVDDSDAETFEKGFPLKKKQYSAILKKAGVRHMGIHSTRHTFATLLLKHASGDGRIKEISEILGHADVSITYKFYISTSNKDKRGLVNLLNNYKKWGKNGVKNEGEDSESSVKQ